MGQIDTATESLSQVLRQLRSERGYSLEAASRRAGISRRLLVDLEQGLGNPSLSTLLRLADGYAVGLADLVAAPERSAITVRGDDEAKTLWRTTAGSSARLLIASQDLELWAWELAAGDLRESDPHRPGTNEIVRMQQGRLVVIVDEVREELTPGQVALFAGDRPHSFENPGPVSTAFALIVHEPIR